MAIAGPTALGLANEEDGEEEESSFDLADAADCGCDVTPDCFSCDLGVAAAGMGTLALALALTSTGRFLSERRRIDRQTRLGRFVPG